MKQLKFLLLLLYGHMISFGQTTNPIEGYNMANINIYLVQQLDTIYHDDQDFRLLSDSIVKKYGQQSKEVLDLWQMIRQRDSINLIKVRAIIDKYGWLGSDVIGAYGNATLFLVIQHTDLSVQEKYLPIMRDAVKKGTARGSDLALLEDRVLIRNGKKQIYGSQISKYLDSSRYVAPLEDPDNVDKRRSEVGLKPMSVYLTYFDMKWDIEQYKKDLPMIEAKEKALYKRAIKK